MKIMMKRPGKPWEYNECKNALKPLQDRVGGYIEVVQITPHAAIICDEEGRLNPFRKYNCTIDGFAFYGTILAVGTKDDKFCSIVEDGYGDDLYIRASTED